MFGFLGVISQGGQTLANYVNTILADNPLCFFPLEPSYGLVKDLGSAGVDLELPAGYNLDFNPLVTGATGTSRITKGSAFLKLDLTPAHNALKVGHTFSYECWCKPKSTQDQYTGILCYQSGSNSHNPASLSVSYNYSKRFRFGGYNGYLFYATAPSDWVAEDIYHLVGLAYLNPTLVTYELYINGVSVATINTNSTGIISNSDIIRIGCRWDLINLFYGDMSHVAFYDYVLSPAQIMNHYIAGTT